MYKFDDEFRPPGRVFVKATRENPGNTLVPFTSTSGSSGSAITTSIDDKSYKYRHDVLQEKTIEAVITDYHNGDSRVMNDRDVVDSTRALTYSLPTKDIRPGSDLKQIVRNRNLSTEVVGTSMANSKLSRSTQDGHRRHVTHIVRKITTLSRAEERAQANNMVEFTNDKRTIELGYSESKAIEGNKRVKVSINVVDKSNKQNCLMCDVIFSSSLIRTITPTFDIGE